MDLCAARSIGVRASVLTRQDYRNPLRGPVSRSQPKALTKKRAPYEAWQLYARRREKSNRKDGVEGPRLLSPVESYPLRGFCDFFPRKIRFGVHASARQKNIRAP